MALTIGGASGSGPRKMLGFEPVGGCKSFGNELVHCVAMGRRPRAHPFVSCWRRRTRTLCLHCRPFAPGRGYHDAGLFEVAKGDAAASSKSLWSSDYNQLTPYTSQNDIRLGPRGETVYVTDGEIAIIVVA